MRARAPVSQGALIITELLNGDLNVLMEVYIEENGYLPHQYAGRNHDRDPLLSSLGSVSVSSSSGR